MKWATVVCTNGKRVRLHYVRCEEGIVIGTDESGAVHWIKEWYEVIVDVEEES